MWASSHVGPHMSTTLAISFSFRIRVRADKKFVLGEAKEDELVGLSPLPHTHIHVYTHTHTHTHIHVYTHTHTHKMLVMQLLK